MPAGVVYDVSWYSDRKQANKEFLKLGATDNQLERGDFTDIDAQLTISIRDLN
jgi:hypothetical protein